MIPIELEPKEQEYRAAIELHRRHISNEQTRKFEGYSAETFAAFGLNLDTLVTRGIAAFKLLHASYGTSTMLHWSLRAALSASLRVNFGGAAGGQRAISTAGLLRR